jgi:hypothetical protein
MPDILGAHVVRYFCELSNTDRKGLKPFFKIYTYVDFFFKLRRICIFFNKHHAEDRN